jgi:hypothetical protein
VLHLALDVPSRLPAPLLAELVHPASLHDTDLTPELPDLRNAGYAHVELTGATGAGRAA